MHPECFHALEELGGHVRDVEPKEVFDLAHKNDNGNTIGKADDHTDRNKADQSPHFSEAHDKEQNARDHGGNHQVLKTVNADDAENNGDKGASGTADLYAGAA